jgi:hypothetical protein
VKIEERDRFQELLRALAFAEQTKPLPPPPGGVYGAEHLRIARSALGRERMEPYATFSGPEMITLAIEGFIAKYLGGQALSALSDAEQARAKAAAREEAARAVRLYCAAQPGYGAGIPICSDLP